MTAPHSPTPFMVYDPSPKSPTHHVHDANGIYIGQLSNREDAIFVATATAAYEANQALIKQLVEALRSLHENYNYYDFAKVDAADQAAQKAGF